MIKNPQQVSNMTKEEAKDEFAKQQNFKDWADYSSWMFHTKVTPAKRQLAVDGWIDLYAKSATTELLERLEKEINKKMNNIGEPIGEFTAAFKGGQLNACKEILSLLSTIKPK